MAKRQKPEAHPLFDSLGEPGTDPSSVAPAPVRIAPPDQEARDYAVNPLHHVVLEASAGTGKTTVLVRRYLNLLEAGVTPAHILAITFTRKAAAEMRERIIAHLRRDAARSADGRARWRELRDRVGDISISTIDAFCLSLLREFPLEADLDPGFRMADDTEIGRLSTQALDHALRIGRAAATTDADLATLFAHLSPTQLRKGLMHLLARRLVAPAALAGFLRGPAGVSLKAAGLRTADDVLRASARRMRALVDAGDGGRSRFVATGPVASPRFRLLVHDLDVLDDAAADAARVRVAVSRLQAYLLKADGDPRRQPYGVNARDYATADARTRHLAVFEPLARRVFDESQRLAREMNVVLARGVQRLFGIAERFYLQSLAELDVIDFSEGLRRAVEMLERMDEFSRSRFRLESRYQHVLVDEFQDTSQLQWRLVSLLIESWREGEGVATEGGLSPTIFVVGDRKQSIYRFRDADVSILSDAGRFISALRPAQRSTRAISTSFRSRPELLAFLNDAFDEVEKAGGRSDAFRYDEQDRFPILTGVPMPSIREPVLGLVIERSTVAMADAVAGEIARLIGSEAVVRDRDTGVARAIDAGDIAILFRARDSHRAFERALEARGVATYVYKGLGFFESDEIQDLVAVLRALAAPHDPLTVAALLRSRMARVSDAGLLALREVLGLVFTGAVPPAPLEALREDDRQALGRLQSVFGRWLARVDRVPPADLVDEIILATAYLFELRGARVVQARENVKKFRALVRRIQNAGYASIARIAQHLDRLSAGDESNAVIDAVNAVSLMTVHASKGLEFPVVVLGDLGRGTGTVTPPFRVIADAGHGEPAVSVGAFRFEADRDEHDREREETKRLLYVAATRARDRLYLATPLDAEGRVPRNAGSLAQVLPDSLVAAIERLDAGALGMAWESRQGVPHLFHVCRPAHDPAGAQRDAPGVPAGRGGEPASRGARAPVGAAAMAVTAPVDRAALPRDVLGPVRVAASVRHLGVREWVAPPDPARAIARGVVDPRFVVTGRLVHRLFAWSPEADADVLGREAMRLAALEHVDTIDRAAVARDVVALVLALRADGALARVLASGRVMYEVPFSLRMPDVCDRGEVTVPGEGRQDPDTTAIVVRGVIDALVVGPAGVTVIEIKTGAPADWHQAQLDLYVDAARALFPGEPVEGLIVHAG